MWTHSWKGVGLGLSVAVLIYVLVQAVATGPETPTAPQESLPEYLDESERNTIQLFEELHPVWSPSPQCPYSAIFFP